MWYRDHRRRIPVSTAVIGIEIQCHLLPRSQNLVPAYLSLEGEIETADVADNADGESLAHCRLVTRTVGAFYLRPSA